MIGSGLGASLGIAAESTYGTYVAPTRFLEINSEDLKKVKNIVQGGGLAAGRLAQLGSRRVVTTEAASGSVELEVPNKGFGLVLAHILGSNNAAVQDGAGPSYTSTQTLTDNTGRSLTVQEGVPDLGGTVRPQTFKGGKITTAEFACGVDEVLTASLGFDFQRYSEVETLAAPTFPTGITPFHFGQMAVKVGATAGAAAAVAGVKKVTVSIERGQATDRFYAGATVPGTKAEPIGNDYVKVSGSFDADFVDKTIFADRFNNDTGFALVWEFIGPVIATTFFQTFRLTLPLCFLDGDTPVVGGPDIVSGSFPFTAQLDGTNPLITSVYTSTDTAL